MPFDATISGENTDCQ